MSEQKRIVRRHFQEIFNDKRGGGGTAGIWADRITNFGRTMSRDDLGRIFDALLETFPDWEFTVDHIIEEGDWVATFGIVRGTYRAARFPPFADIEPRGQRIEWRHMHWFRVEAGCIVEHFAVRDDLAVRAQLMAAPPAA